jgi:hypothetical protein
MVRRTELPHKCRNIDGSIVYPWEEADLIFGAYLKKNLPEGPANLRTSEPASCKRDETKLTAMSTPEAEDPIGARCELRNLLSDLDISR